MEYFTERVFLRKVLINEFQKYSADIGTKRHIVRKVILNDFSSTILLLVGGIATAAPNSTDEDT